MRRSAVPIIRAVPALLAAAWLVASENQGFAQSAAEHAAQAHGQPIVKGHPVQPRPDVVKERLRHHKEMLEAEKKGSVRPRTDKAPASGKPVSPSVAQ